MNFIKLPAIFQDPNQPDYTDLEIDIDVETITDDIYVNPEWISHYHINSEGNINVFINGEKWSVKLSIDEFNTLMG